MEAWDLTHWGTREALKFNHICGKGGAKWTWRSGCHPRFPWPSASLTPATSLPPLTAEWVRGVDTHGLGVGSPWRAPFSLLNRVGSLGRNAQPRILLPVVPREGPSRMPRSRTEGWGHFKAEGSFSVDCLMERGVYGCWVHGGNKLPGCVVHHCISAGVPSAPSLVPSPEVRAVSFKLQSLRDLMDDVSVGIHSIGEKNRTLPRQATSGSAPLLCGLPAAEGHPVSAHSTSVLTCFHR